MTHDKQTSDYIEPEFQSTIKIGDGTENFRVFATKTGVKIVQDNTVINVSPQGWAILQDTVNFHMPKDI